MSLLCKLGSHRTIDQGIWNDGLYFSNCGRCGAPLIRRPEEKWTGVPRNYAVVWSENRPDASR